MAELTTLARPYAKAAFEYAVDNDALQQWSKMLGLVAAVSLTDSVSQLLTAPSYTAEQKVAVIADVCGEELDAKIKNLISVLAQNKRLELLPFVAELFEAMKAQREKTVEVEVTTAFELSGDMQDKLANALRAKLDRDVNVLSSVEKSLLGGVLIRAGDTVIDGSVRGRLAKLAEAMNS